VRDALTLIDDIHDRAARDGPGVVRLPAGRRIKRGAVEVDGGAVWRPIEHARVKFPEIRICVVKPLGHEISVHI
jgi:hypothetical protein